MAWTKDKEGRHGALLASLVLALASVADLLHWSQGTETTSFLFPFVAQATPVRGESEKERKEIAFPYWVDVRFAQSSKLESSTCKYGEEGEKKFA